MKVVVRIAVGIIGLVIVVLGLKQIYKGVGEMSGKSGKKSSPPSQQLGETYTSAENGYSHKIPQGWENKPNSQAGIATTFVSPASTGLASNMVTTIEPYQGTLADYIAANKQAITNAAPDAKFLSDSEFSTDARVKAHKVKLTNKMNDIDLAQTMYFFEAPNNKKIIITCTAPAKHAGDLEPLFDGCMKTFAVK